VNVRRLAGLPRARAHEDQADYRESSLYARAAMRLAALMTALLLVRPSVGWLATTQPILQHVRCRAVTTQPILQHVRCRAVTMCARTPEGNEGLLAAVRGDTSDGLDLLRSVRAENERLTAELESSRVRIEELEELSSRTEGLCEVLDDGGGWTSSLRSRATWLLGLLVAQSCSSFVLADNEQLLVTHPTVIFFMTMLVGAGGNAGNQAAVRIIRGLATGEVAPNLSERTTTIITDEVRRAFALGAILVAAGFVRVIAFNAGLDDALAISASLFIIVSTSVVFGTLLPLLLSAVRVDAANASTTIQVIMDVLGVVITCTVAKAVFAWVEQTGVALPAFGLS